VTTPELPRCATGDNPADGALPYAFYATHALRSTQRPLMAPISVRWRFARKPVHAAYGAGTPPVAMSSMANVASVGVPVRSVM
jgi:hypothetical protein